MITRGQVFGHWTVVGESTRAKRVRARCVCGTERDVNVHNLRRGGTKSCGCQTGTMIAAQKTKHGLSRRAEYAIWKTMRQRCANPANADYAEYGGRGIRVDSRWDDFATFLADVGPRPSAKHSLDRIDNALGYTPGNVRWATAVEQANNRRPRTRGYTRRRAA